VTEDERDRLLRENEQLDAELVAKVAESRPKLEQLAATMGKPATRMAPKELNRLTERLVEMAGRRRC
jgi:hypothetical protein